MQASIPLVAGILGLALVAAPAQAQDSPYAGLYLGAGVADNSFTLSEDDCDGWYDCDEWSRDGDSDDGWTITAGWRFNRWFAIEATHAQAGVPGWTDFAVPVAGLGGLYDVQSAVDFRSNELAGVAMLPLGRFDLYAKLGVARYEADTRQRVVQLGTGRTFERAFEQTGTEPVFGIGAGVSFAERARLRLEVRGMPIDRELLGVDFGDATLVSVDLQLQYRF